eukprot:gene52423-64080_t
MKMRYLPLLAALAAASAQAQNLVVCTEAAPEGFDIVQYTGAVTADATAETVFNRLLAFKPGTTEVIPALAKALPEISADGLTYTFHLRAGVKFHSTDYFKPTREFNADDVLFTYHRQLDKTDPWNSYFPGANWEMFNAMDMPSVIKDIVKVDEKTVKFVLKQPDASLPAKLALNFGSIMSKEYADKLAAEGRREDLGRNPVGTGPRRVVAYQQDAAMRLPSS